MTTFKTIYQLSCYVTIDRWRGCQLESFSLITCKFVIWKINNQNLINKSSSVYWYNFLPTKQGNNLKSCFYLIFHMTLFLMGPGSEIHKIDSFLAFFTLRVKIWESWKLFLKNYFFLTISFPNVDPLRKYMQKTSHQWS